MTYKIRIAHSKEEIEYEPGKSLLEILQSSDIFVENACNGKGVCGKCKVRVISGHPGQVTENEKSLLKKKELSSGIRLACLIYPKCNLQIELLQNEKKKYEILNTGYVPEFHMNPGIRKELIEIERPSLDHQTSFEDQICRQLDSVIIPVEVICESSFDPGIYTAVIHISRENCDVLMSLEKGDTRNFLYGVGIDIGTTTVVAALIDLKTGRELAGDSMINAQERFGSDVLSRITYEIENPEDGINILQKTIVTSLNEMIKSVCRKADIFPNQIYEIAVSANSTMLHILLGIDAVPIGKSPYAPMFVNAKDIPAESIGILASRGARLYCLPGVSAYIGADIVAGTYVCALEETDQNILFIDIGTNGEIVLSKRGQLICCSCAAGPALEGMNISCGMQACEGAVEDLSIDQDGVHLSTIGGDDPAGLCGSGILSAVKELVRTGIVQESGAFIKMSQLEDHDYRSSMIHQDGKKREFIIKNGPGSILVTQKDVRQVQLAKGAILSGFYALLNHADVRMDQLDKVMIAGQFGSHLPVDSLIGVGILPEDVREKLVYVGNSSKTGACMALLSQTVKREMEDLAGKMQYIELGAIEGYERLFADSMMFPDMSKNKGEI